MIQKVYFRKNNIHPINSPRLVKCSPTSNSPISSSSLSSLLSNSPTDLYNLSIDSQSPIYNNKNLSPNFSINKDKNVEFFNKKIIKGKIIKNYKKTKPLFTQFYKTEEQNKNEPNLIKQVYSNIENKNGILHSEKITYFYNGRKDELKVKEYKNCEVSSVYPHEVLKAEEINLTYNDTTQNISKKIIKGYEFNQYLPNDGAFVAKECKTIYKPQNENSVNIIESCYKDIIFRNNFTIFRSKKQISTYSNKITKGFEDAIYYNELGDETEQNPYSNIGNETNVKCANCYISYNKETNIAVIYTNPSFLNGVLEYNKKEINKS